MLVKSPTGADRSCELFWGLHTAHCVFGLIVGVLSYFLLTRHLGALAMVLSLGIALGAAHLYRKLEADKPRGYLFHLLHRVTLGMWIDGALPLKATRYDAGD